MDIKQLLIQPESKILEFHRDLSSMDPILKTIVAFANTAGGILVIGRSADGILKGVQEVFKAEATLAHSIADSIQPSILPDIEIVTVDGKDLLIVKVPRWRGPFYLKREGTPKGVYIRLGAASRAASPELLAELHRSVLTPSFDQEAMPDLNKDSLDLSVFHPLKQFKKDVSEEKLRSLGILVPFAHRLVPSIGGLILFGKEEIRERSFPHARVRCARFLGDTKANILDTLEMEGTLLTAVDQTLKFIARNTRQAAKIVDIYRKDIPEYSPIALREGLINAIVHTDYSITGSNIQIDIYDHRLEILNPGMFPFGFTMDDFKAGMSKIRNRVIARVFYELKLMEKWGSGYQRIMEACHAEGYPEPKWEEFSTFIRVTFYPHQRTFFVSEESQTVQLEGRRATLELSPREKAILNLFDEGKHLPFREIFAALSPKISERTLKYDLAQLRKKGLLLSYGKGRATLWRRLS